MANNLLLSLVITALGMGIVFGTILALWGLMAALTRFLADRPGAADSPGPAPVTESEDRAKAVALAVAVAVALAEQGLSTARPLPVPPTALVSAWQLGMRTRQMSQKGERFNK
jgi:Na+-transporting methylmalonyl-CoA/oxaloacetate decarboxylase gamma subunit